MKRFKISLSCGVPLILLAACASQDAPHKPIGRSDSEAERAAGMKSKATEGEAAMAERNGPDAERSGSLISEPAGGALDEGSLAEAIMFLEDEVKLRLSPEDGRLFASFEFANAGDDAVTLSEVHVSCGCMQPRLRFYSSEYPDSPVFDDHAAPPIELPAGVYGEIEIKIREDTQVKPKEYFYLTLVAAQGSKVLIAQAP